METIHLSRYMDTSVVQSSPYGLFNNGEIYNIGLGTISNNTPEEVVMGTVRDVIHSSTNLVEGYFKEGFKGLKSAAKTEIKRFVQGLIESQIYGESSPTQEEACKKTIDKMKKKFVKDVKISFEKFLSKYYKAS